jgi:hypothetical protein
MEFAGFIEDELKSVYIKMSEAAARCSSSPIAVLSTRLINSRPPATSDAMPEI